MSADGFMQSEPIENKVKHGSSQGPPNLTVGSPIELDIEKELEQLRRSGEWRSGVARKILVSFSDFQIILRAMKAGTRIPEHHNPGRISVQSVRGHLRMHAGGEIFDLPSGKVLILDRAVMHDVEAVEDSAFLLTVALPQSPTP